MSNPAAQTLKQAHRYIENGQLDAARALVEPLLDTDPGNPDVWWVYVHALDDARLGREALDKLITIAPDFPGAIELSAALDERVRKTADAQAQAPIMPDTMLGVSSGAIDDEAWDDDQDIFGEDGFLFDADQPDEYDLEDADFELDDDEQEEVEPAPSRLGMIIVGLIAIMIVGASAALVTINPLGWEIPFLSTPIPTELTEAEATPEPSPVVMVPTSMPATDTVEPVQPTETVAADTATPIEPSATATAEVTETPTATEAPPTSTSTSQAREVVTSTSQPAAEISLITIVPQTVPVWMADLVEALSAFDVTSEDLEVANTSLGETLIVTACSRTGADRNQTLSRIMTAIAQTAGDAIASDIPLVGVRLVNCSAGVASPIIVIDSEDLASYGAGEIDDRAFQALLQPID